MKIKYRIPYGVAFTLSAFVAAWVMYFLKGRKK